MCFFFSVMPQSFFKHFSTSLTVILMTNAICTGYAIHTWHLNRFTNRQFICTLTRFRTWTVPLPIFLILTPLVVPSPLSALYSSAVQCSFYCHISRTAIVRMLLHRITMHEQKSPIRWGLFNDMIEKMERQLLANKNEARKLYGVIKISAQQFCANCALGHFRPRYAVYASCICNIHAASTLNAIRQTKCSFNSKQMILNMFNG